MGDNEQQVERHGPLFELATRQRGVVSARQPNVAGFELDAYWAAERFVVELEVFETHGTRVAFERDRIRQDDLMLIGVEMIRVTGPRLKREPEKVIERVASHLHRRRNELSPGPTIRHL